jgi:molecular chaperone DnaK (HSP70)
MVSYSWTKMLLDQKAVPTEYDDPDLMKAASNGLMKLPRGKTAKDVVADYLKGMHKMFMKGLLEKGLVTEDEAYPSIPMEIYLSVPATWSDEAKWATRTAALDAGFGTRPGDQLKLIAEPEAAAHLALKDSVHHVDDLVKVSCLQL